MYSYLSWTVLSLDDGKIAILVANTGLGFEVLPTPLLYSRASIGEVIEAHIHHHITDVSEALFAFASLEEKRFFRKLMKVDGVGGKTALSLLGLWIPSLARAIESGDEKMLASVPGIGKKTALKVIVELKNEVSWEDLVNGTSQANAPIKSAVSPSDEEKESIITTLVGMGYDRKSVERIVENIPAEFDTIQTKTVWALRSLAK